MKMILKTEIPTSQMVAVFEQYLSSSGKVLSQPPLKTGNPLHYTANIAHLNDDIFFDHCQKTVVKVKRDEFCVRSKLLENSIELE